MQSELAKEREERKVERGTHGDKLVHRGTGLENSLWIAKSHWLEIREDLVRDSRNITRVWISQCGKWERL